MAWPYDDDLTDPITQLYGGKLQPLPPDQTRSMLSRIGGGLTGGLAEIGDLADKFYGGRAIRGLLGGHARELLSVLPGSDTLGITDEQEKTTGRQLLDQYGLTKPKKEGDSGFDLNDALGIAAEIGLSPGSLPGKLGSLVPRTVFGGLNAAAKPAGLGVKALTGINPYTTAKFAMDEAGRVGGALFDKSTGGTWGKNVQNVARSTYSPELAAGREAASQADAAFRSPLDEISKRFADPREAAGVLQKEGQRWVEGDPTTARSNLLDYGFNQGDIQTVIPHIERYTSEQAKGQLGRELAVGKESAERSGLSEAQAARRDAIRQQDPNAPLPFELQAQQTYIPRTALGQDIEGGVRTSPTGINRANQFQKQAENLYKGVPGGAPTINEMFMNPSLAGKERGFADEDVKSKLSKMIYGEEYGDMPGHWAPKPTGNPNVDASLSMQASGNWQKAMSHVDQLSERLKNATAPEMERGIFSNDLAGNILARNYASAHQVAGGKAVLHALDKNSGIMDKAVTLESKGIPYVKVPDFLDSMHMSQQDANGTPIAMQKIAESLGLQPADAAALKTQLHEYAIPQDVANDISRMGVAWKNNSVLQPVLDAYSGYMQNLKANLTFPFPSFSARNLMQGVFDMWRGESLNTESGKSMSQMLRGGSLTEDAARKLHPDLFVPSTTIEGAELPVDVQKAIQEASVKTRNEMMASKMAWSQNNQASEKVGSVVRGARDIGALPEVGGEAMPWSEVVGNFAKGYVPEKQSLSDALKSPLDSETFIPTRQGQKLGNATEDWIRGSHYLGARMKGLEHGDAVMETMKYQRDYNNLSEFEKNVMKKLFPFYCMPIDHEILTQDGWKTVDQIQVGQLVMTYSPETGDMEWQSLEAVSVFEFDGELLGFSDRKRGELCFFTEEHTWPVVMPACETTNRQGYEYSYPDRREMRKGIDLATGNKIPWTGQFVNNKSILTPRLAAILGWVVTDGYHRWRGGHCEMIVYQSPAKFLRELMALLDREGRSPHPQTGVVAVPVSLEDSKALTQFFKSKADMPSIVGRLSREAAEAMWDAMFKAEGSVSSHGQMQFAQDPIKGKHVLEAFQMLCLMTGRNFSINKQGGYVLKSQHFGIRLKGKDKNLIKKGYVGRVWCPTTKSGTWIVRHNGYAMITGNTFTRRNLPPILEDLVNKPAKLTGAIRASTSQEDNAYVPQYPGEGTAINVGQTPEGKTRFLSSTGLSYEDEAMKALGNLASGNVSRALQNVGGQLTPLLKAPIEQMTNTQLMTGKNLSDVKANLAGNLAQGLPEELGLGEPSTRFASAVSQIAGGTPLSRYVTTASKLADPRTQSAAGLANLASGLNFTDVDVPQQQQIAVRDKIIDAMRGTSGVQTWPEMNVPQDKLASLSPGQLEMYRFFKGLEQKGKADSKARKARKDLLSPLED